MKLPELEPNPLAGYGHVGIPRPDADGGISTAFFPAAAIELVVPRDPAMNDHPALYMNGLGVPLIESADVTMQRIQGVEGTSDGWVALPHWGSPGRSCYVRVRQGRVPAMMKFVLPNYAKSHERAVIRSTVILPGAVQVTVALSVAAVAERFREVLEASRD